jgi:hypothetical protein
MGDCGSMDWKTLEADSGVVRQIALVCVENARASGAREFPGAVMPVRPRHVRRCVCCRWNLRPSVEEGRAEARNAEKA